ncbi:MAG: sigma-70 family RNA polymerase sigma factor [Bacteroidales bacterium]|jgi:RNA polymerase sigma factor (sigma-70 family)
MLKNDVDIRLLRDSPDKLLIRYQPIIRIIVKNLAFQGYLPKRDINDLIQEVNRKLIERLPRIRDQYNNKSQFRTYFSVVIRNLCMEDFRKLRVVTEPQSDIYEQTTAETSTDQLVIRQEFERLKRALRLFGQESQSIWIVLRTFADLDVTAADLEGFDVDPGPGIREQLAVRLNEACQLQKREKMEALSAVFSRLDRKPRTADAVRKWSASRIDELLVLMNGKPPRSAYTVEILCILLEKSEITENSD